MCGATKSYAQNDTLTIDGKDIEAPILYSAKDSIFTDFIKKQVHLFGEAKVDNGEIKLKAGYILIDLGKNEVYATYRYAIDSSKIEFPNFTDGNDQLDAQSIRYNFNTEKAYIEGVSMRQDENYIYMERAKRHSNEEIHFLKGRFTTCDLPEPHYHFQLSKAVMIPEKRIVSGPMNLWVNGVPTPLGVPFSVIPQMEEKTKGLTFPEIVPFSNFGFGFQDLGYYFPVNDRFQTTFYGTLYNRGSWGLRNQSDYAKRYGYVGNLGIGFQQFRSGFPENNNANKVSVFWNHSKDSKSSPFWNFSSKVNFISDNNTKNDLDPLNPSYLNNTLTSDISLQRKYPGKPLTTGARVSVRQNSMTQNIALTSPVVTANLTRIFPFKDLVKGNQGWKQVISRFGFTYNFEGQNKSTFGDSLLRRNEYDLIANQFQNGISQNIVAQTTAGLFKNTWKFTPSINYSNYVNFQQTEKLYDPLNNKAINDTIQRTGIAHLLSINAQLTTVLYTYYKFIGKKKPILRHIITPSFSFRYTPNLNELITDSVGIDKAPITYSPFETSVYRVSGTTDQALITFGFNNTLELKRKSDKDTVTGFKKTRIVDLLSFDGAYDILKDSMNWSNISVNLRVSPIKWINFVSTSSFSPYGWNKETGQTISAYAIDSNQVLGRFTSTSFTTTLTLTSAESRKHLKDVYDDLGTGWNSDYKYFILHPEAAVNFKIPWKMSFSHQWVLTANQNKTEENKDQFIQNQTLRIDGDVSVSKRWKFSGYTNIVLDEFQVSNTRLSLLRDLHCWELSFFWTPIGTNKSFQFGIRSKSNLLQDAKIQIRKPPAFL